jgi:antitoxin FitA
MYIACMPNVQIREVPDDVHQALVRRAEVAGQSLQQYLAAQLAAIVATPTIDELIARIEARPKGRLSRESAKAALQDERARR